MPDNSLHYDYPTCDRRKHKWTNDFPGFVRHKNAKGKEEFIGKCPHSMNREEAQKLLDEAICYPKAEKYPDNEKIYYNIDDNGVVYVAYITNKENNSYHGMPWRKHGRRSLPSSVKKALTKKANEKNILDKFNDWIQDK